MQSRFKRKKNLLWWGLFSLLVLLPTGASLFYALTTPTPLYVSETAFSIRNRENKAAASGFGNIASTLGVGMSGGNDIYALRAFLASQAALDDMERAAGFIAHAKTGDFLTRLSPHANREEKLTLYNRAMSAKLSTVEQIITIKARAYSPKKAQAFALSILASSENFINRLNERANRDFLKFAESEVVKAEKRVADTRLAMTNWRNLHASLDPLRQVDMVQSIVTSLESELAKTKADILELRNHPQDMTPRLRLAKIREEALLTQIAEERLKLTGTTGSTAALLSEYERLSIDRDLADKLYASSLEALKDARQEVSQQQKYIVVVSEPSLTEEVVFPRPLYHSLCVLLCGLVAFGLALFGVAVLKDYRANEG
jgi:capsular polysaccharide transport system permease protein